MRGATFDEIFPDDIDPEDEVPAGYFDKTVEWIRNAPIAEDDNAPDTVEPII